MNLRGLLISVGAGGSLIAAALCAAVLAGGLLAFRGGVDDPARARAGDVTVPGATASSPRKTPVRRDVATIERRAAARRDDPGPRRVRPTRRTTPGPPSGGDHTSSTGEDAGGGSGPATPAPPPADGEQAGTVRRTVQQAREAAAPVGEAGPAVNEVADTVDETVTGLVPR